MDTAAFLLFWLLVGHVLCDYPLQGEFLSKVKNHTSAAQKEYSRLNGGHPQVDWWAAMGAHSLLHSASVMFVTGVPLLALLEFAAHFAIDFGRCDGWYRFRTDQFLHVACKAAYVALVVGGVL